MLAVLTYLESPQVVFHIDHGLIVHSQFGRLFGCAE